MFTILTKSFNNHFMKYLFEGEHFGISEDSLHLLRSRYSYKTYKLEDVSHIELGTGKLVNNWIVILIIGIGLIGFSLYYAFAVLDFLQNGRGRIYVEEIVVPVLPFLMGLYCLYAALRSGPVLQVEFSGNTRKNFPLDRVKKEGKLEELVQLLKNNPTLKSKSRVSI